MNRGWTIAAIASIAAILAGCEMRPPVVGVKRVPAEERTHPWTGIIPLCDDGNVEAKIIDRFAQRESEYWQSGLRIIDIDRKHQVGMRSWGVDIIPRRYCQARAILSDGSHRGINYHIVESGGIIGATWGVEWCVQGLDRHNAFAPHCKQVLP